MQKLWTTSKMIILDQTKTLPLRFVAFSQIFLKVLVFLVAQELFVFLWKMDHFHFGTVIFLNLLLTVPRTLLSFTDQLRTTWTWNQFVQFASKTKPRELGAEDTNWICAALEDSRHIYLNCYICSQTSLGRLSAWRGNVLPPSWSAVEAQVVTHWRLREEWEGCDRPRT